MTSGQHTYAEIMSQPAVWTAVLESAKPALQSAARQWREVAPKLVLFTGCGSTYYLSLSAAALLQGMTGIPSRGVPASEIVLFPNETIARPEETLLVAVSRSGTTTETAAAISRFRELGGKAIWGITCYPETPVSQETDFVLLADAAQEESVAQTRSFSSMLLLTQALAATAGDADLTPLAGLSAIGTHLVDRYGELAESLGANQNLNRYFFLGSGPLYGIACEAMLKMKEMSISYSEAFHFMEFRHGPKSMVDENGLVVGLLSQRASRHEAPVLAECMQMGGSGLAISPGVQGIEATHRVLLPHDVPEWARPVLYLPVLQLMAYYRSVNKSLDPDNPRNLTAVVELDRESLVEVSAQKR